jgi:hypothetical protein
MGNGGVGAGAQIGWPMIGSERAWEFADGFKTLIDSHFTRRLVAVQRRGKLDLGCG